MADPRTDFVIDQNPDRSSMGHKEWNATFCKSDEAFFCFDAQVLKFAIPKDFKPSEIKQSWHFGGQRYTVFSRPVPFAILGQEFPVFYVDSETQDPKIRFYFSTSRGLVGLKGLGEHYKTLLLLEQACGFAAPPDCKNQ